MRHVVAWFVVLRTLATAQHSIRDGAGSDINESAASGKEYCFCIHADQRDLFLAADTAAEQVRGPAAPIDRSANRRKDNTTRGIGRTVHGINAPVCEVPGRPALPAHAAQLKA
jgi:hypothetical protein